MDQVNPIVFISYSHDSDKHKEWVLKLATHLRMHGVDAILDQWDARLGCDLPFFMENGLSNSKLVLCICTEAYVQKANNISGGVGYEKCILTQKLLDDSVKDFIIPIIKDNSLKTLPLFLSSKIYADFSNPDKYFEEYEKLLERIYGEDTKKKPKLGISPFSKDRVRSICVKDDIKKALYMAYNNFGIVEFLFKNNDGKFTIGSGEYLFVTKWSECGDNSIYAYSDYVEKIGYNNKIRTFPDKERIELFDFSSRYREVFLNEILIWINESHNIMATKILSVDNISNMIKFEYKIY